MPRIEDQDPYAPPPRYKNRSGAMMRFVILAALLGAAAWGYVSFMGQQQQSASLIPPAQQEMANADEGYQVRNLPTAQTPDTTATAQTPSAPTPAQPEATPPAPASDATPG